MKKTKDNRKYLVFLTSGYPFGNSETFIENEIPFLLSSFEKVLILVPEGVVNQGKRFVPENVIVVPIPSEFSWLSRVKSLLCQSFWKGFSLDLQRKNWGAGFFRIFRNCWHYYTQALQAKKTIQNTSRHYNLKAIDTVLYSYWLDQKALGIALVKKKMPNIKAVSRAHGWDVFEERHQPPYLPFRPLLFKNLDKVAVVSKKGAEYLKEKFNSPKGKVLVSYLGTNLLNEKRKINNEKFSIISCSSLIPLKRVELIIEALSLLDFPVSWTHIGDGQLREKLEQKAASLFKGRNIDYNLLGQLSNIQVRDLYKTRYFNLFISTSNTEGLPVSMMEAQSAGIPILSTDVGGVNEIVIDGITGWLMPPDPVAAGVAEKIREVYELQEAEKQMIGDNAFKHWKKNFYAEKNYAAFISLLQNL